MNSSIKNVVIMSNQLKLTTMKEKLMLSCGHTKLKLGKWAVLKDLNNMESHPYNGTHFFSCSSHLSLSFLFLLIPLALANSCHFVSGLGLGTGLARGRIVVGAGSRTTIASSILSVGNSQTLFNNNCVLSRAKDCRYASLSLSDLQTVLSTSLI